MKPNAKEVLIVISPIIWGVAFIGAVKIGHFTYLSGLADPILAAILELTSLGIGLLLSIGQLGMAIRYALRRRWIMAASSLLTPPIWCACIVTGISMGAAIVYAT